MMNKPSLLILVLIVMFIASISPASAASFSDSRGHWAQAAIDEWNQYGVVNGYDGEFRPNSNVTRAEFASILDKTMKYVDKGNNPFSDVNSNAWYADSILKLHAAGVLQGSGGKALPGSSITRQEAAVLIAKAFNIKTGDRSESFKDDAAIASWAKDAVYALASLKAIKGMPNGSFNPKGLLTKAEAVTILNNLVQDLIYEPGEYTRNVQGNLLINSADVILNDMKITGDLYIAQGVGEGEVTLNNVEIEGSVYVRGGGEHSVIFNSVDVKGSLVVNKNNGKIRILATGSTSVAVTKLESGGLLVTKELQGGGFETVEISAEVAEGQEIVLDGSFQKVTNYSSTTKLTANGTIKELVAEADTKLYGEVKIDKLSGDRASTSVVNDKPAEQAVTGGTTPPAGGSTGPSTGGDTTFPVSGVSINENNVTLSVGQTKTLTATVSPGNATNKNVSWSVKDGSNDVVTVSQSGLVTAIGIGTKVVRVVTESGAYASEVTVTVTKAPFSVEITKFAGDAIDDNVSFDEAVIANSDSLTIRDLEVPEWDANRVVGKLQADKAMQATEEPTGHYAYVVVTLKDVNGVPVADTSGITVSVTQATYSYTPVFGEGLGEGSKTGSIVLKFDAGEPEKIQAISATFTHQNYATTDVNLRYIPYGTAIISSIEPITGTPSSGSTLTAGQTQYEGTPANSDLTYTWSRSASADGPYTVISGATGSAYVVTDEDSGKYIRVQVSADQVYVGGEATSAAFGPIELAVGADDVFAAIEREMLGSNANLSNVLTNLNLMTALSSEFTGVTISWSSDNTSAISNAGVVTRSSANDQLVQLTATLSGSLTGTKTYDVIVRKTGLDDVSTGDYVDEYFVDGYPQAYIKEGKIWARYMLNKPAEVYMIVNAMNGHWDSDVKAVLEGHAGTGDSVIYVDQWPYFAIGEDQVGQVQEFNTETTLGNYEARVAFVIKDSANEYISSKVTTILFDTETVVSLDEYPPNLYEVLMNKDRSAIYLFYSEKLDESSVPEATDFTISNGTISNVEIHNYDNAHSNSAYVKLTVSGITDEYASHLQVSYTGTALRDTSDAHTIAEPFSNRLVNSLSTLIQDAVISSDRKSINFTLVPGFNTNETESPYAERVTVLVDGTPINTNTQFYGYSIGRQYYYLRFVEALPAGDVSIVVNTEGLNSWTYDAYPDEVVGDDVKQIGAPGTPSANYEDGVLTIAFSEGYEIGFASAAAGLVLEVDGVEYSLRGFIVHGNWYTEGKHDYSIDLKNQKYVEHVKKAIDEGTVVRLKFAKTNGNDSSQLQDSAGTLLPDFDYVTVTMIETVFD